MQLAFVEVELHWLLLLRSLRGGTLLGTVWPRLRNQAEKMDILRLFSSFALMHREAVAADADATLLNAPPRSPCGVSLCHSRELGSFKATSSCVGPPGPPPLVASHRAASETEGALAPPA